MKILLATGIYPPDIGGPATYSRTMASELTSRFHDVEVICYTDKEVGSRGGSRSARTDVGGRSFWVYGIPRSWPLPVRYFAFAWKVFRRARAMKADLVYLQGPVSEGFPGTIGAILAGKQTVMKVVGDYAWEMYQGAGGRELLDDFIQCSHWSSLKVRFLKWIERWTARRAKRVITPSQYLKSIVEQWKVSSERIDVVYNSVDAPNAGLTREAARRAYDLDGKRIMLTAVRAVPWKNIDFIIRLLRDLSSDVVLVIAGDGPELDAWKAEAQNANVSDRVRFLGKLNREALGGWYRAADLFVLPSGYEGYPNVIPEAWSQGLPCFVSDRGGNVELCVNAQMVSDASDQEVVDRPVTVLKYLDQKDWLTALRSEWPKRFKNGLMYEFFKKNAMVTEVERIFQHVI